MSKPDSGLGAHEQELKAGAATHDEGADHQQLSADLTTKLTGLMIFFSAWIGLGGFMLTFDLGYTGTVLQMAPFNRAFGHCGLQPSPDPSQGMVESCRLSATQQSVGSSIHLIFLGLGSGFSGFSSNYLGRKGAIQLGCVLASVGAGGMIGTAGNFTAYVACKCIGAIGIGHFQAMGPMFGIECTPARYRGFLVAFFSIGGGLGYLTVSLVCWGTSAYHSDWSWKVPIVCQVPIAVVYGVVLQYFPESPRWLLTKSQEAKAHKSFGRFYNKDPYSEEVKAQIREVEATIEMENSITSTTSWVEIFHRSNIRRTLTALAILLSAALSGAFAIFTYAAIFLSGVGISNPYVINVIINACVLAGETLGPFTIEYLGRRRTVLFGYAGMASCMLIFAAVSSGLGIVNPVAKNVLIVFLCLWSFIFGSTIASAMWVYASEIHSVRLRTYGQSFAATCCGIMTFAVNFWTPYMINAKYGNMGTNIGYFFFALEAIAFVVMFLWAPETGRLTLEQIDDFYHLHGKAWKTSLSRNKRTAAEAIVRVNTNEPAT